MTARVGRQQGRRKGQAKDDPAPAARSRRGVVALVAGIAGAAAIAAAVLWPRLPGSVRRERGLDVLLITIDTLRADALGCYGNTAVETPWIDHLAAGGVRFEQVHAQNVVTLPSHANILSGRYPLDHGVRDNSGFRFPAGVETLATLLKRAGYATGAFVSAFPLDSRFGLDRGFDVYDDRLGDPEARTAFLMPERPGARTVEEARKWRAAQGTTPTFTWIHLYEPHFPYVPPEPFASRYAASPYHGEVAYTDSLLAPVSSRSCARERTAARWSSSPRPRRRPRRARREDARHLRVRDDAARALDPLSPRALRAARHGDARPARGHPADGPRRPRPRAPGTRGPQPARPRHRAGRGGEPSYFEALSSSVNRGGRP
jgi:hypothetical protein